MPSTSINTPSTIVTSSAYSQGAVQNTSNIIKSNNPFLTISNNDYPSADQNPSKPNPAYAAALAAATKASGSSGDNSPAQSSSNAGTIVSSKGFSAELTPDTQPSSFSSVAPSTAFPKLQQKQSAPSYTESGANTPTKQNDRLSIMFTKGFKQKSTSSSQPGKVGNEAKVPDNSINSSSNSIEISSSSTPPNLKDAPTAAAALAVSSIAITQSRPPNILPKGGKNNGIAPATNSAIPHVKRSDPFSFSSIYKGKKKAAANSEPVSMTDRLRPHYKTENIPPVTNSKLEKQKKHESKHFSVSAFSSALASGATTAATAVKAAKLASNRNPNPSSPGLSNDTSTNNSNTLDSRDTNVTVATTAQSNKANTMTSMISSTSFSAGNTNGTASSANGVSNDKGKFDVRDKEQQQEREWIEINESPLLPGSKPVQIVGNGTLSRKPTPGTNQKASSGKSADGFGDIDSGEILRPLLGFSVMSYNVLSNLNSMRLDRLNFKPTQPLDGTSHSSNANSVAGKENHRHKTTSLLLPSNFNIGHGYDSNSGHSKDHQNYSHGAHSSSHTGSNSDSNNPLKLRKDRVAHIIKEIKDYKPDIICLQELDANEYYSQMHFELANYESVYAPKQSSFSSGNTTYSSSSSSPSTGLTPSFNSPRPRPISVGPGGLPPIGGARGMSMAMGLGPNKMVSANNKSLMSMEGSCIFYKADKFQLLEKRIFNYADLTLYSKSSSTATKRDRETYIEDDDLLKFAGERDTRDRVAGRSHVGVVAVFKHKTSGRNVIVANTQLVSDLRTGSGGNNLATNSRAGVKHSDPKVNELLGYNSKTEASTNLIDVRLVQIALCIEQIDFFVQKYTPKIATSSANNGNKVPVLLCGDLNSGPSSSLYQMISGETPIAGLRDWNGRKYARFTDEKYKWEFAKRLDLRSAYQALPEPQYDSDDEEVTPLNTAVSVAKGENGSSIPLSSNVTPASPPGTLSFGEASSPGSSKSISEVKSFNPFKTNRVNDPVDHTLQNGSAYQSPSLSLDTNIGGSASQKGKDLVSPSSLGSNTSNNPFLSSLPSSTQVVDQHPSINDAISLKPVIKVKTQKPAKNPESAAAKQILPFTRLSFDEPTISDYIFYSSPTLAVSKVLGPSAKSLREFAKLSRSADSQAESEIMILPGVKGTPHTNPSDHLFLLTNFVFKI